MKKTHIKWGLSLALGCALMSGSAYSEPQKGKRGGMSKGLAMAGMKVLMKLDKNGDQQLSAAENRCSEFSDSRF